MAAVSRLSLPTALRIVGAWRSVFASTAEECVGKELYGESVYSSASDFEAVAAGFLSGSGDRWAHVRLVSATMRRLASELTNGEALVGAAWLHDIGYAPELVRTGMHALDGASFLDLDGAPREVVSLVAYHTGAEFEAEERGLLDEFAHFDPPSQDDLDLLILADLVSGASGEPTTVCDRLKEILDRYEPAHPVHRAVTRSSPYLEDCARRAAARVGYPMKGDSRPSRA
jgi:hypothetical protein